MDNMFQSNALKMKRNAIKRTNCPYIAEKNRYRVKENERKRKSNRKKEDKTWMCTT